MAIDLGDPYPLAVFVTDDLAAPANAGNVVVTVTLPDLTVATPAVVNATTGTYTAVFVTTQPGRHLVRWVATGVNACAFDDEFNVDPADAGQIISLADARAALGRVAADRVKDEDLRSYIAWATPIMENLVGSILRQPRVETYDGGRAQIVLLHSPLVSVTSVVESYGSTYERTLTLQSRFDGTPVTAYGYDMDLETGLLTRLVSGVVAPFPGGRRNIQVSYVSGRAAVTGNLLLATRLIVRQLWLVSGQQGFRPGVGGADASGPPVGFAVPNAVLELCASHARPPGAA